MHASIAEIRSFGSVEFSEDPYMIIELSGCVFKCPWCNTPELLETKFEHEMDLKDVKREITGQVGNVEGVFLTGGEPLFQKAAIVEILRKVKDTGMKGAIDTNGSKPEAIEYLLKEELVSVIIMDMKSPFNEESFDKVTKAATFFKQTQDIADEVKQTLKILQNYDEKVEVIFRTTIVPGLLFRKEDILEIANEIEMINSSWELQAYKSTGVTNKKMSEINSPTDRFLENLCEAVRKEKPNMNVRIKY